MFKKLLTYFSSRLNSLELKTIKEEKNQLSKILSLISYLKESDEIEIPLNISSQKSFVSLGSLIETIATVPRRFDDPALINNELRGHDQVTREVFNNKYYLEYDGVYVKPDTIIDSFFNVSENLINLLTNVMDDDIGQYYLRISNNILNEIERVLLELTNHNQKEL